MLVATSTDVDHLRTVLMRAALPVVDMAGVLLAGDRIVIGTYAEAKGLSFDHVLMPGLRATPKRLPGEHDVALLERSERLRRLQYVGITRARHGLWLGYLRDTDVLRTPPARTTQTSPTDARRASTAPRRPGWRAAGCALLRLGFETALARLLNQRHCERSAG